MNPAVTALTRLGISVWGSRVLRVRGRTSWREVPVNLLVHEGRRFLVAPRGRTQWVRNLRAAGGGELRLGRRTATFTAREVPAAERVEILRAYLRRWRAEVGVFFGGVGPASSDGEIRAIASAHPVFVLGDVAAVARPRRAAGGTARAAGWAVRISPSASATPDDVTFLSSS